MIPVTLFLFFLMKILEKYINTLYTPNLKRIMKLLLLFYINLFKIMDSEEIKNRLLKIVLKHVGEQYERNVKISDNRKLVEPVTLESRLCEDLGMDSLNRIELAIDIEKAFSLPRLDDAEIGKWVRVSDSYRTICDALKVA